MIDITKKLVTKETMLEQGQKLRTLTAEDITFGEQTKFAYDEKQGVVLQVKSNEPQTLEATAVQHLLQNIGLPQKFFNETTSDLAIQLLNYWYQDKRNGLKSRLLKETGKVTGVAFNPRDQFVSLDQMIETIEASLGQANIIGYHNPYFDWSHSNINVVLNQVFAVNGREDLLNIGIRFVHSFNEIEPTRAFAYVFRQFCSNGAITEDTFASFSKRSKGMPFRKWVDSVVVESTKAAGLEQQRLQKLLQMPTNQHTSDILNHVMERSFLPKDVQEAIRTEAIDANAETMYDVYNILTRVSTHHPIFSDHPTALPTVEKLATGLSFHSSLCPVCKHEIVTKD